MAVALHTSGMERISPDERPVAIIRAIVDARRSGTPLTFTVTGGGDAPSMEYHDGVLRLDSGRDSDGLGPDDPSLGTLLDDYPVFKIDGPATRTAEPGVVYLSAVADPKHIADFIEDAVLEVFDAPSTVELGVERGP